MFRRLLFALAPFLFLAAAAQARSPQGNVDTLLAADRAFAAGAARAPNAVDGLAPMFDTQIFVVAPGQPLIVGRDAALAAFRANPAFVAGHVGWAPIRGGISADGTQGFTFGFLSLTAGDPAARNRKYLAYWIRRPDGWHVIAYRQTIRQAGEVSTAMMPPSLPSFTARPTANRRVLEAHRASLAEAERAFSDRAQQIGLHAAFMEVMREDAMSMYAGAGFSLGREAVAANFNPNVHTSPVRWSTERSFVASSGDLGVSIGTIHANSPGADGQYRSFSFFTIWRRDRPNGPWRYLAE